MKCVKYIIGRSRVAVRERVIHYERLTPCMVCPHSSSKHAPMLYVRVLDFTLLSLYVYVSMLAEPDIHSHSLSFNNDTNNNLV